MVLEDGRAVGVVPETPVGTDVEALAALAGRVANPTSVMDRVESRRALPTLAGAAPGPLRAARAAPPPVVAAPPSTTFHLGAAMPEEVVVRKETTIEVSFSRDVLGIATGRASGEAPLQIDPQRILTIQVSPRTGFEIVGDDRVRLGPVTSPADGCIAWPEPGQPFRAYFDVLATDVGDGEIWVLARQGQVPLATIKLQPAIVERLRAAPLTTVASSRVAGDVTPPTCPIRELRITEQDNGGKTTLKYELQAPDLGIEVAFDVELKSDRVDYMNRLYEHIENGWTDGQPANEFDDYLRAYGADLFEEVFPIELQRILWEHRAKIDSILLSSTEPFIPWEIVHLKEPGRPVPNENLFLAQLGLVRWAHGDGWGSKTLKLKRGAARYVIPNYPDPQLVLPEAQVEAEFLEQTLRATPVEPRLTPVRELLRQPGTFDVLHFACHGEAELTSIPDAHVLLEGRYVRGQFQADTMSATVVRQNADLKLADGRGPLVVLNACRVGRVGYNLRTLGGFAHAFVSRGAGAFIGTLWSVGDTPARTFTEAFYTAMLGGSTLAEATVAARTASREAGEPTWLAYVVYGYPCAVAD